jgi:D-sedoheptulose 7-phosphate isomerase
MEPVKDSERLEPSSRARTKCAKWLAYHDNNGKVKRSIPVKLYLAESIMLAQRVMNDKVLLDNIAKAGAIISSRLVAGSKVLACGNGGSMSDAMHFCSELTGRYRDTRDPLPAIALSDPGAMSCIANDFGYDQVFGRQVCAMGREGDVLLAITTSGRSENVLQAVAAAMLQGMAVIALTGDAGLYIKTKPWDSLTEIRIPSVQTNFVQEMHIKVIHILVELIEQQLIQ